MSQTSGNVLARLLARIDAFQQRHRLLAIPYAVIKKYGDDEAGYQGALITYYGFLSLFPLLIVATSVIDLVSRHNDSLRTRLISGISDYFPSISSNLQTQVHGSNKTGLALIIGLLIAFYGARGIANAIQHGLDHIWQVPRPKRAGFPKGTP
ncbi:MAG: YhjD/YihY/BrkB family envelope integrity protein [Candidatus Saccharibacteria bacterium]